MSTQYYYGEVEADSYYANKDEVRQAELEAQQADPLRAVCSCDYGLLTCDEECDIPF